MTWIRLSSHPLTLLNCIWIEAKLIYLNGVFYKMSAIGNKRVTFIVRIQEH